MYICNLLGTSFIYWAYREYVWSVNPSTSHIPTVGKQHSPWLNCETEISLYLFNHSLSPINPINIFQAHSLFLSTFSQTTIWTEPLNVFTHCCPCPNLFAALQPKVIIL